MAPKKKQRTSSKRRQAPPPKRSDPSRFVLGLIAVCGLLVLLNNAGLVPQDLRDKLTIGLREHASRASWLHPAEPRPSRETPREVQPPRTKPQRAPIQAVEPPVIAPTEPAVPTRPTPVPESAPEPVRPPEPEPEATPAPALAPRLPGTLTLAERRSRVADLLLPDAFTPEWTGGPAVLKAAANELSRGRPDVPRAALTFDGNFDAQYVGALLKALRAERLKATFFLTGKFGERFPETVKEIAAAGHEIANHSMTHPHLTRLDDAAALAEVERAEQVLLPLAGRAYRPYFRPPFGDRDVRVLRVWLQHGYLPVYWTADTLDWQPDSSPESVITRVRDQGTLPGAILLCHAGAKSSLEALPQICEVLREAGLEPGPLSDVLRP